MIHKGELYILGFGQVNVIAPSYYAISVNIGSMSNNVGDNLNQQNLLNYTAASIAN